MKDNKEKVSMLYELKDRVKGRIMFIENSSLPENEVALMLKENEIFLRILNKVIDNKLKPIQTIETVRGTSYKVGDTFCINGNENTKYTIEYFPDSVTVRGVSKNPEIGKPWIVESYIEDIFKPKKKKEPEPVKEVKRKRVDIEVGDYFALRSNNTVYKATKVKKNKLIGINELTAKTATNAIITNKFDEIILKTKKDYKKQHKAEKNYVEPKTKRLK